MNLQYELEVITKFIISLKTTYSYLFDGNILFYNNLDKLMLKKIDGEIQILELQSKIYELLEANDVSFKNWYSIYHSLHMNIIRDSRYASEKFSFLLNNLLNIENIKCKNLLVPACGKFFEFKYILDKFNAENIFAEDINVNSLEFTRGIHKNSENLFLKHVDLTREQKNKTKFDIVLFMHPQVTDYDKLANSNLYKRYDNEFKIPYTKIKRQDKIGFMDKTWDKIILNCLERLENNGYVFFIFYEYRELDIVLEWFNKLVCYKIINVIYDDGLLDFAFAKDYLNSLDSKFKKTAQYIVMGAYRAGLVVQKVKLPPT